MARPTGPVPEHGTRQRYQLRGAPCHCPNCCAANAKYRITRWRRRRHIERVHAIEQQMLPAEYLTGWMK